MDDRISQQINTTKEDHSGNNHNDIRLHNHSHDHNHNKKSQKDFNNVVEFSKNEKVGQNYDEFYVSGVD
ncbi:MAG: hypothetical protein ACLFPS_06725 [Clostridia bacterium]